MISDLAFKVYSNNHGNKKSYQPFNEIIFIFINFLFKGRKFFVKFIFNFINILLKVRFCFRYFFLKIRFNLSNLFTSSKNGEIKISRFKKGLYKHFSLLFIKASFLKAFDIFMSIKSFVIHKKFILKIHSRKHYTIKIIKVPAIAICFAIILLSSCGQAEAKCTGIFVDPIGDICWECLFPVTLGSIELVSRDMPDTDNSSSPICLCPKPSLPVPVPGIAGGFWEPVRLVDITKQPFCFVNLDGMPVEEICRKLGIANATFYRWKQKYRGLLPSEVKKLKQLEEENKKLKQLVADLSLGKHMLQEVISKKY